MIVLERAMPSDDGDLSAILLGLGRKSGSRKRAKRSIRLGG